MDTEQCMNYGFWGNKVEARVTKLRELVVFTRQSKSLSLEASGINPLLDDLDYALGTVDKLITMRSGIKKTPLQHIRNMFQDLEFIYLLDKQTKTLLKTIALSEQEI